MIAAGDRPGRAPGARRIRSAGHPSGLFADLYEFTMLDAYHALGMDKTAVFSLFVRKLPPGRNFLVACGVDDLLDDIQALHFQKAEIAHLASLGLFRPQFLDWLQHFRFTGAIHAVAEGTPVFANEPLLEVVAPIAEAQLLEILVINQIGFQTLIASKAARVVQGAQGRSVIDFGGRRAHGLDAAIKGARATYDVGALATSNAEAGALYGIPVTGTVAHSFVQAFPNEMEAFRAFSRLHPNTTLLVDTYDTLAGVESVIALARELGSGFRIRAVRLDSGDLLALSCAAREMLDGAGLQRVRIVARGDLDEWKIDRLVRARAPIDAFGVGTDMLVSTDAPALDIAYKLASYDGQGRMKFSPGKRTLPGAKHVFRRLEAGRAVGDIIARHDEALSGRPLLEPVMVGGRRTRPKASAANVQASTREAISELPEALHALAQADRPYPVSVSASLAAFEVETAQRLQAAMTRSRAVPSSTARPTETFSENLCPVCGGVVREEHGVWRCTTCGQVVEGCCEGAPPPAA